MTSERRRMVRWPDGKDFAFTIFDDTDYARMDNVPPVYEFLKDQGFRTTKSVWPLRDEQAPAVDRSWREVAHRLGGNGLPVLEEALAWVECTVEDIHPGGDHEIVIGRVGACGIGRGDPLVLWDRAYWGLQ